MKNETFYCEKCEEKHNVYIRERSAEYKFRKEDFKILESYAECEVCGEEIYHEASANQTLAQLSAMYQEKVSLSVVDIKRIRQTTGLTQSQFAKVVGIGEATIKRYEAGTSLPDHTQLGLLQLLKNNPHMIMNLYKENKELLTEQESEEIQGKLMKMEELYLETTSYELLKTIYANYEDRIDCGNRTFEPEKLFHMILFFSVNGVLKIKLMKLLWYADFLMYKRFGKSISGASYRHMTFGPVLVEHDAVIGYGVGLQHISIEEQENIETGYTKMTIQSKVPFNSRLFNEDELATLVDVKEFFSSYEPKEISEFVSNEKGWISTVNEQSIPYSYASDLQIS